MVKKIIKKIFDFKHNLILLGIRFIGIIALFLSYKLINISYGEIIFGEFSYAVVISQIGSMFISFGLPILTLKEISKQNFNDHLKSNQIEIINTNFSPLLINSIIVSIIMILLSFSNTIFPNKLNIIEIISIILSVTILGINNYLSQVFRSFNKSNYFQWITGTLPFILLSILLIINLLLKTNFNIYLLYLLSNVFTLLYGVFKLKKIEVNFKISLNFNTYVSILKKSFNFFVTQIITQGFNWFSILITMYLINEIDTGGMNIIVKYISLTSLLIVIINTSNGPIYTNLYHSGKIVELNKLIKKNNNFMVLLTSPIIIILFLFSGNFLEIFSKDYIHLDLTFKVVLIGGMVNLFCGSVGMLMQLTSLEKEFRNIMISALILHILLGYFLTNILGVFGLGLSMTLVLIYWNIFSSVLLLKKCGVKSYFNFL